MNSLAVLSTRLREPALMWAPEVEWAVADGVAVELELPIHHRELHALKTAFQITLPWARQDATHGVQMICEYGIDERDWRTTGLYLLGARLGKWSALVMVGARTGTPVHMRARHEALINPGVYHDLTETLTVGVEANVAVSVRGDVSIASIPQVHWQITRSLRVQVGGGVALHEGMPTSLLATRIILE